MFCPKCGTKNVDDAKFCVSCGFHIENPDGVQAMPASEVMPTENVPAAPVKRRFTGWGIAGFVVSLVGIFWAGLICGILGIIFSAIGMRNASKPEVKGKGLAIAGLVISIIDVSLILLGYLFLASLL